MTPPSNAVLEAQLAAILDENSNQKLLGFWELVKVVTFLLIHSSPREMVRMIVRRRPIEDLLAFATTLGTAGQFIRQNDPSITEHALAAKAMKLMPMLSDESPEYAVVGQSMKDWTKNPKKTKQLTEDFIEACGKPGFNASAYAASHAGLLSLAVDQYLLAMSITSKAPPTEIDRVLDAIWTLRLILFDCRNSGR